MQGYDADLTDLADGTLSAENVEYLENVTSDVQAQLDAKVGITQDQADAIVTNTAKVGYTDELVSANSDVATNTAKVGFTDDLVAANSAVVANTAKVGYTDDLVLSLIHI